MYQIKAKRKSSGQKEQFSPSWRFQVNSTLSGRCDDIYFFRFSSHFDLIADFRLFFHTSHIFFSFLSILFRSFFFFFGSIAFLLQVSSRHYQAKAKGLKTKHLKRQVLSPAIRVEKDLLAGSGRKEED